MHLKFVLYLQGSGARLLASISHTQQLCLHDLRQLEDDADSEPGAAEEEAAEEAAPAQVCFWAIFWGLSSMHSACDHEIFLASYTSPGPDELSTHDMMCAAVLQSCWHRHAARAAGRCWDCMIGTLIM